MRGGTARARVVSIHQGLKDSKPEPPEILERAPHQCSGKTNLLAHWVAMLVCGCRGAGRTAVLSLHSGGAPLPSLTEPAAVPN